MTIKEYFLKIDYYLDSKIFFDLLRIGLFDYLSTEKKLSELSCEISIDTNFLLKLLNISCEKNWIINNGENFVNNEEINIFFNRNSKKYIGDLLLHKLSILDYSDNLTLKKTLLMNQKEIISKDFSTQEIKLLRLEKFSEEIKNLNIVRALDLGCGTDTFSLEISRQFPNSSIVLFDKNIIIEDLKLNNYNKNLIFKSGNFLTDSWGNSYDLIIASGILDFTYNNLEVFFKKIADSLNPNGYIFLYSISLDKNKIINPDLRWLSGTINSEIIPVNKEQILKSINDNNLKIVKITEDEIYPLWILEKDGNIG